MTNTVLREPSELVERVKAGRDALRYVLNWAESNTRVSTVMKTFTLPDRSTTREKLEHLYKDIERLTPTPEPCNDAEELREERDALLERPISLAKMDSIDEDATDKMVAYYWWQQAQNTRAEPCRLREALVEARARLECIANSEAFFPDEEQGIVTFADALQNEAREGLADIDSALSASPAEPEEATEAMVEDVAFAMAAVIARRHGHQRPDDWLNDERREEARAAITAMRSAASGGDTV